MSLSRKQGIGSVENKKIIGIFPGSFDPFHVGHLKIAVEAVACRGVDFILVVPSYRHPYGKKFTADFDDRFKMIIKGMETFFGDKMFGVSGVEQELGWRMEEKNDNSPIYTIDVLKLIKEIHFPDPEKYEHRLIVGKDVEKDIKNGKWKSSEEIQEITPIIGMDRCDDISSSSIRTALSHDDCEFAQRYVPAKTWEYIDKHGLYWQF